MFTIFKMYIFIYTLILSTTTIRTHSQGSSISFSPNSPLCIGEEVEMVCFVESSVQFRSTEAQVSINSSLNFAINQLNSNSEVDGIDLSRYRANIDGLSISTSRPGIRLIINSYQPSDSDTVFGCHGEFTDFTVSPALVSGQPNSSADPPSPPTSLQSSVSNFNTATCTADISLTWNTPPSYRTVDRYFLYLDESPLATTNSNNYIHSTILNINTDYQYSVTAMSCAGNSTNSSANVNSVERYSLMRSSQYVCLAYDNVTGGVTVNWGLSTPTQPSGLDISYSLQLLYSHSRQGVTYKYTDSTSFTLPSSQLSYNTTITAHNFTQLDGVETNIAANLTIVQQCGQSFTGTAMECFFNSNNPAILSTSSIPNNASIPKSSPTGISSSSIQMITTAVPCNTVSTSSSSTFLPTSIIFALLFLISLVINLIFIIAVILLIRKIRQLKSPSKSQPAPSHPYEYVDLDKMSGSISSPTQQQSPQDYVPMSSVHKQDTTDTTTHYANLK